MRIQKISLLKNRDLPDLSESSRLSESIKVTGVVFAHEYS